MHFVSSKLKYQAHTKITALSHSICWSSASFKRYCRSRRAIWPSSTISARTELFSCKHSSTKDSRDITPSWWLSSSFTVTNKQWHQCEFKVGGTKGRKGWSVGRDVPLPLGGSEEGQFLFCGLKMAYFVEFWCAKFKVFLYCELPQ